MWNIFNNSIQSIKIYTGTVHGDVRILAKKTNSKCNLPMNRVWHRKRACMLYANIKKMFLVTRTKVRLNDLQFLSHTMVGLAGQC